jgi:multiple sugar transport system permease protein
MTLAAYSGVLGRRPVGTWLVNSLVVACASVALSLVIATLAGYSLSRFRSRAQEASGLTLLVSKMLPGSLIVIPFYIMFANAGLVDNRLALVIANTSVGVPFATWMMKGFFDGIPPAIEEAALLDGCGHLGALWRVAIPLALPGTAAVALYAFIVAWNDFLFARAFLPGGAATTLTVGATQFLSETEMEWNRVMAVSLLATLPVGAVFIWLQRHFVGGLTQGHN